LPPVSTTLAKLVAKFDAGVIDTGGKFAEVSLTARADHHPQSNGMVERTPGQLKAAWTARLTGSRWPEHLPWVLLGLRTAQKKDSSILAAELVY